MYMHNITCTHVFNLIIFVNSVQHVNIGSIRAQLLQFFFSLLVVQSFSSSYVKCLNCLITYLLFYNFLLTRTVDSNQLPTSLCYMLSCSPFICFWEYCKIFLCYQILSLKGVCIFSHFFNVSPFNLCVFTITVDF